MSQLPDQLLKSSNMPVIMPLGPNMNIINGVPIPQPLQSGPNMPPNPNTTPMGIQASDQKDQANQGTSNYFL